MGDENGSVIWIGTQDAAALLGVSIRALYRLLDDARIPSYRFGRSIRLKRVDIDAFIKARAIERGTREYPEAG